MTLRGSILEDAVASTGRHGTVRGLPLKEVLEQVVPELNVSCLRLALSTPKVTEQLLKLDEQGVSYVSVFAFYFCSCVIKLVSQYESDWIKYDKQWHMACSDIVY